MQIYRPFVSIKKSVACLSNRDLYTSGCINCDIVIKNIFDSLDISNFKESSWIKSTKLFSFYFNNGNPFLKELFNYRNLSYSEVKKYEGIPRNHNDDLYNLFKKHEFKQESGWNAKNARYHKIILLKNDHFWYKRFFHYYRNNVDKDCFLNRRQAQ
jgi:hypothetical protein